MPQNRIALVVEAILTQAQAKCFLQAAVPLLAKYFLPTGVRMDPWLAKRQVGTVAPGQQVNVLHVCCVFLY